MTLRDVLRLARAEGITIELADLGDYGTDELRAEYDPAEGTIRVNVRLIDKLGSVQTSNYIAFAIAHELYHHREHRAQVARLGSRSAREQAADEFASALLAGSR